MTDPRDEHADEVTVEDADRLLDEAWLSGGDVEQALAMAKRLSLEVGRDPVIEDAKVALARCSSDCTPSQAFELLVRISQNTNRKVALVSHEVAGRLKGFQHAE